MKYILAIDQGTSSTKSLIFDESGIEIVKGQIALHTDYLDNGFVQQDPEAIYQTVIDSVSACLHYFAQAGHHMSDIVSCGISNQRETFTLWDESGKVISPAIVWSCKRSSLICQELISKNQNELIHQKTGLIIDPYFSATKLLWLITNDIEIKNKLDKGELYFGTIDTWLLYKMTKGKSYKTDYTNAHRTLLFNIYSLRWDEEILRLWGLEKLNLPVVCPSSFDFGKWDFIIPSLSTTTVASPISLAITAMIGDSHAAAFGEGCFEKGDAKITLGTGCSIMVNTGAYPIPSDHGMLTTICWSNEDRIDYALEGTIIACGSMIEWIKKELNLFGDVNETEQMATKLMDNGGVYLIPAFSGLGAPHWQMHRKASIHGLTFGTTKNHLIRAALESIPYQIKDVFRVIHQDMAADIISTSANGGLSQNQFVMQFLADLLGIPLKRQNNPDVSALGAAYLSGIRSGVYKNIDQLIELNRFRTEQINPDIKNEIVISGYNGWLNYLNN